MWALVSLRCGCASFLGRSGDKLHPGQRLNVCLSAQGMTAERDAEHELAEAEKEAALGQVIAAVAASRLLCYLAAVVPCL